MNKHRPFHIFLDDQIYFLTVTCYKKQFLFKNKEKVISQTIFQTIQEFKYHLYAWVILLNHLHLLFKMDKSFKRFITILNGRIAYQINQLDNLRGRKVIYQYWDYCIRSEADFYKHFNYIHHNPVKHGYVKNQKEVLNYPFSSYKHWSIKKSREWLDSCYESYPIIDFTIKHDSD